MRALKFVLCCAVGLAIGKIVGGVIDPLGAIIVNILAFLATLWLNPDNASRSRNWNYEFAIVVATATLWATLFLAHLDKFR